MAAPFRLRLNNDKSRKKSGVRALGYCPVLGYRVHNTDMRTGELARSAGVNLQTIRFYERQGLLSEPTRTAAGYRCYAHSDLERVTFIKRNQELGFTLAEIKQLLDLHAVLAEMGPKTFRKRPGELQGIIDIGRERLLVIDDKIKTLNAMRHELRGILDSLESSTVVRCPAQNPAKSSQPRIKESS